MTTRKYLNIILSMLVLASLLFGGISKTQPVTAAPGALPVSPTDETKVPHYFGPNTNWALSPFTIPDVAVAITDPTGLGAGATAVASVGANGVVTGLTLTSPGSGYTDASVSFTGAGIGAAATATVATSGAVTGVNVSAAGSGYTAPTVVFSGGGGTGVLVQVGNALQDRAYATDFPPEPSPKPVFVVVPTPLPTGTLTEFLSWNQPSAGGSPPSAGETFRAYVLRPTGTPDQYSVLFASPLQTVPPLANPTISQLASYPVGSVPVLAGDVIAFYGAGIPLDLGQAAPDRASYPAPVAPLLGDTVALGSAGFPLLGDARSYSFAASVIDASGVAPLVNATATAYGGVDAIALGTPGSRYTFPTVNIDFPDAPDGVQATAHATIDGLGAITAVVVDESGSGYLAPPKVAIINGTLFDPIRDTGFGATATATLKITSVTVDTFGAGYVSAPTVTINDPTATTLATASATVNAGAVTGITLIAGGSGYVTPGGIQKFTDALPGLCNPAGAVGDPIPPCPASGKYIPLAVGQEVKYPNQSTLVDEAADQYDIGLVQYRTSFSSSLKDPLTGLPVGTLVRGYVQLETAANASISQHFPLYNEMLDGTQVPVMKSDGVTQWLAVTPPQYLGPIIAATKNKPARLIFRNLLPTGSDGDLFLPVDSSLMGSGMGPMDMGMPMEDFTVMDEVRNPACTLDAQAGSGKNCFKNNRATLHLHGGTSPWISDGTVHQWITPAGENTTWPEGVSVANVPDMPGCDANDDGCMTFYYTNQQSARLMFYHDHAWGITRLNVYAGEAAGYLITDDTEKALLNSSTIPGAADTIPLIIQDKTFVPQDTQMYNVDINGRLPSDPLYDPTQIASYGLDPTWDASRWGGYGNFWYHHVYMPAQNPGDPGGMSAYGRWMYGPWFWPPAANTIHGPIANPYYDQNCNLDDPLTWQYQTDPFCEPQQIPGTPNISVGMEQFNDTPIVNGVAYPTITLEPKTYRFRILSAANDRFFNFQWYVGDPTTASTDLNNLGATIGATEVALNPAELAAAQTDPVVFPTPVQGVATAGPDWIQIGTEGGFLPAPVVVDGQQPTTWITDPTRFDVGNVDLHSLLLAPAERADVIVDFSKFAGQTLILYNDAPAAFPARVPSYDYYTGAPDLSPNGAPAILPGYGPNTRTIMQVKIAGVAAPAFNLTKLRTAFSHKANGSGVFESGQHPIIVGQAAYNSAYGSNFAAGSNCNAPGSTLTRCDGFVRVSDTQTFGFNTLSAPTVKMTMDLEPKAIHDEMNATTFDEFGRMQANLGVEAQPPTPGVQNVVLYPMVNPATELIDGTNLPKAAVTYDPVTGLPVSDVKMVPISSATDGTQIWRITHNGVDTHPIHFHLYDVQVVNRVTWDNIIIPPDLTELGWKDTVRIAPLEDTIVALRPLIPQVPWELPNAIRPLSPMMPTNDASGMGFNSTDPNGIPTALIINRLVNFGWDYLYHCHILSHEEMDMMRPVSVALPPIAPDGLVFDAGTLTWNDNSINETSFLVQRSDYNNGVWSAWADVGTSDSPLNLVNTHGTRSLVDTTYNGFTDYQYRVIAYNRIGYGAEFPEMTVQSMSMALSVNNPPAAPTNLTAVFQAGPQVVLNWSDNATNETGFVIERAINGGLFATLTTLGANATTYTDATVVVGTVYRYQVAAVNAIGTSAYSNVATVNTPPLAPTGLSAAMIAGPQVQLTWFDNAIDETNFDVQRCAGLGCTNFLTIATPGALAGTGSVSFTDATVAVGNVYQYQVAAVNAVGPSAWSNIASISVTPPAAPTNLTVTGVRIGNNNQNITANWIDAAANEAGFTIQRSRNVNFNGGGLTTYTINTHNTVTFTTPSFQPRNAYYVRIRSFNAAGVSVWVNATPFPLPPPP